MKKLKSILLSLTLSITTIGATLPASAVIAATPETSTGVTMYRLYNSNSGEHFYTKSASEKTTLVTIGWSDEGIGWIAPETSTTPVYRLYNVNTGDHHYTTSSSERAICINAGWNDEGIGWYSDDNKTVPLYREYNPYVLTGTHNYTADKAEHNHLISLGWIDEGIGWYAISDGKTDPSVDPVDPTDPVDPVDPTEPEDPVEPKDIDDNLEIGDIVILGTYEQDNNLTNGAEPIEWEYIGDRDGHKLLLSKYALIGKQYNEGQPEKGPRTTWENCTLRKWLNNEFYNTAFSSADKKMILTAHNEDPDSRELYRNELWGKPGSYGGNNTDDNVFLLSWVEAEDYLDVILRDWHLWNDYSHYNLKSFCKPTTYAATQEKDAVGVLNPDDTPYNIPSAIVGGCKWILRSPGAYPNNSVAVVTEKGDFATGSESANDGYGYGIRPALLVD